MSPWTNFRGLHSWRKDRPRAVPFAIFRRVDQVRVADGLPVLPETFTIFNQNLTERISVISIISIKSTTTIRDHL